MRAGDEPVFAALAERLRRELQVYCYRMVGSFEESEDLVQETFLRAWRARASFEGRASVRAWLYRIATNACLDVLERRSRRTLPHHVTPPWSPDAELPPPADQPWLQPFPDQLLEVAAPPGEQPDTVVVTRETIELVFLAAIQYLPPRQRAAVILRDVLGWRAREVADLLDVSVPAVNSALQRARETLRRQLPEQRHGWARTTEVTAEERTMLRRFMDATERADIAAIAELLADDVRATMPPWPMWFAGKDAVVESMTAGLGAGIPGRFRMLAAGANRQPAAAAYVRRPGDTLYRAFAIELLRFEHGRIVEITAIHDIPFEPFGLPRVLDMPDR
ncbi:sigma-70 family RNA polymerase sigma factor [Phytoactinopolyspora sp. XMNu-373]|uniref:RNA polymerase sigma factor n=1 Tax=Phytoactinopolyspora mesophila TaxID=2650750 RepID=A0A7K3LZ78_9ACTN|nr:sigma-70 family RNA polymerase sigma factor [Phytoactinopolyspora mesophila]NDL55518.1 sigma-70 family RNA polymerase sigma factor [Phytoactinopolyspora mesophila]